MNIESPPTAEKEKAGCETGPDQDDTDGDFVTLDDFISDHAEPQDDGRPIDPCPDCGGELAEPSEQEEHFRHFPHAVRHESCSCNQSVTDGWCDFVEGAQERWRLLNSAGIKPNDDPVLRGAAAILRHVDP